MYAFNGFTEKANLALNAELAVASELGHTYIGSEHILYGLCSDENGVAATVLKKHNISRDAIYHKLETAIGKGVPTRLTPSDFTPAVNGFLKCPYMKRGI